MAEQSEKFDSWAVVELFGHTRLAGKLTEQTIGGCAFLRLDVPEQKYTEARGGYINGEYDSKNVEISVPAYTKFLTQGAIYSMTPCTEDVARKVLSMLRTQPIQHVELGTVKMLPAPDSSAEPPDPEAMAAVGASTITDDDDEFDTDDDQD